MKVYLYFFLIPFLFFACAKGYGTSFVSGDITIYYNAPSELNEVKILADFWTKNGISGNKKQFLRLYKTDKGDRQLQIIATKPEMGKALKFEEIKLLQELENKLNKEVFIKDKIDLVICDSRFTVLNDLNY